MHIKGENLDSNGPEHICMSWITKCVQKASTTLWAKVILITAGFIGSSIWFRCCNLFWLMPLSYANFRNYAKVSKNIAYVNTLVVLINQAEVTQ